MNNIRNGMAYPDPLLDLQRRLGARNKNRERVVGQPFLFAIPAITRHMLNVRYINAWQVDGLGNQKVGRVPWHR